MLVFLSNKPGDLEHISTDQELPTNLARKCGINAKVLFKNESVFVCSLKKGKNPIVYCPTQLHFNDFEYTASKAVAEGDFCKLAFIHDKIPIAILEDTHKLWQDINRKRKLVQEEKAAEGEVVEAKKQKLDKTKKQEKQQESKKEVVSKQQKAKENEKKTKNDKELKDKQKVSERKRTVSETKVQEETKTKNKKLKKEPQKESENQEEQSESENSENEENLNDSVLFYEDKAGDKKAAARVIEIKPATNTSPEKITKKPVVKSLTGVNDFWNLDLTNISKQDESSDEDEDANEEDKPSTKKKLTAAEKFKQQREEEARLRAIEEKYADPNQLPDSVDQFDRLVLSDPNNSKHWINYMVFHLQSTEIDKARAVARRALKTISFRNSDDQINIWVALLNLELRYGSKETFNDTLKEALMYNEPLKIYLRTVEIITDAQKTAELIDIIGTITKKFKTGPEVWRVAANAFFTVGMTERAQQLLHKALACLPDRDRKY